jgi:hypothetical protein
MAGARTCEHGDQLEWSDVPGWVVLLDERMNEVVPRQECSFYWHLTPGGAVHEVTTAHAFDIQGKTVTYVGVGGDDKLLFMSIIAGHPLEGEATIAVGGQEL